MAKSMSTTQARNGDHKVCEICSDKVSLYKCPACACKTCSLECVRKHKVERSCTGKRNAGNFVLMSEFDERQVLSDYHFLEDISRTIRRYSSSMNPQKEKFPDTGHMVNLIRDKNTLVRLEKLAASKGIKLKLCPFSSKRGNNNSTHISNNRLQPTILWHIQWIFGELSYQAKSVNEHDILKDIVGDLLKDDLEIGSPELYVDASDDAEVIFKSAVRTFLNLKQISIDQIIILLCADTVSPGRCYYKLDSQESLLHNLSGKSVVEHPILVLTIEERLSDFSIISESQGV